MEKLSDSQYQRSRRCGLGDPKGEHALGEPSLHLGKFAVYASKLRLHLRESHLHLRAQLGNALLELRVKALEVEFIQLAQLRAVGGIHHVEPVHELVSDIIAKLLIELARQLGVDRHTSSWMMPAHHNTTLGKHWYQENAAPLTNVARRPARTASRGRARSSLGTAAASWNRGWDWRRGTSDAGAPCGPARSHGYDAARPSYASSILKSASDDVIPSESARSALREGPPFGTAAPKTTKPRSLTRGSRTKMRAA